MKLPTQLTYGDDPAAAAIICYPPWSYSVNLQAALWRRSSLLRLLDAVGAATAAEFELAASQHYNERLTDFEKHLSYRCNADTPLYLDADPRKSHWPLPYHNLMHAGSVDARHLDFLEAHGLNELLEWGQAEDAGTAFGSDYHVLAEFRRLVRDFNVQTIVETATRLGRTTEVLATLAEQVFSLAPGEALDARAIEDAKNLPNVQLLCGDAEKLLTDVLANVSGPVIAYLNIESTTGLHPIAVLGAIARSDCKPLIAIHGVHVPGTDYRFESLDGQDFRWEWLETSIRQIFGANGYLYYYNRQAAGARRGIVYVVPRGQS